ncbi:MAG: VIT1/CCC1 transporter family protein [Candidatus Eremiobacteraeota bacterium]|nr:VIT1/CCC1 transporter family protein [Candidatus Eremiobacteraeota bacterium]MBV8281056.1 VIT1/CCC1 transporter family protein [Candidatus Eremiobacteraeota bacterium]
MRVTTDKPSQRQRLVGEAQSGTIRAAVLGISDGLVTNVSLILGVAGANAEAGFVRLAGLASLVAGAGSMAVGEYISMQAQRELLERVLRDTREDMRTDPESMIRRLTRIFEEEGVHDHDARHAAETVAAQPEQAVQTYVQAGLGFNPSELGSPIAAALSSLVTFAIGALIPLLPWYVWSGDRAALASIILGAVCALAIGAYLGRQTGKGLLYSALRQLLVVAIAASITYLVGRIFRVPVK